MLISPLITKLMSHDGTVKCPEVMVPVSERKKLIAMPMKALMVIPTFFITELSIISSKIPHALILSYRGYVGKYANYAKLCI